MCLFEHTNAIVLRQIGEFRKSKTYTARLIDIKKNKLDLRDRPKQQTDVTLCNMTDQINKQILHFVTRQTKATNRYYTLWYNRSKQQTSTKLYNRTDLSMTQQLISAFLNPRVLSLSKTKKWAIDILLHLQVLSEANFLIWHLS